MSEWFYYHNKVYTTNESVISLNNRAINYGDGFFESIRVENNIPQYWSNHILRIFEACSVLQITPPNEVDLLKSFEVLLKSTQNINLGRLKIVIFRKPGGLYTPIDSNSDFMLSIRMIDELKKQSKTAGICPIPLKMFTPFSKFKTLNSMPYIYAGLYMKQKKWDEVVILNASNRVCETLSSNIFWIENKTIFTTPISEGCISGVMRNLYIKKHKVEEKPCTVDNLLLADKIFVTNAIDGITEINLLKNV
ncbi:MAG: aminotransferase class IV [Bacteroidota bacterium]